MPNYTQEGEAIEGIKIYCEFKERPSYGIEKETERETITITGNPAVAIVIGKMKYEKKR